MLSSDKLDGLLPPLLFPDEVTEPLSGGKEAQSPPLGTQSTDSVLSLHTTCAGLKFLNQI